jgi:hypothetical protein
VRPRLVERALASPPTVPKPGPAGKGVSR